MNAKNLKSLDLVAYINDLKMYEILKDALMCMNYAVLKTCYKAFEKEDKILEEISKMLHDCLKVANGLPNFHI